MAAKFLRGMISAASSARYSSEACLAAQPVERGDQVAQLLVGIAGLAQLVAARVASSGAMRSRTAGIGVVPQPGRRLHDVGVGVVDDAAAAL